MGRIGWTLLLILSGFLYLATLGRLGSGILRYLCRQQPVNAMQFVLVDIQHSIATFHIGNFDGVHVSINWSFVKHNGRPILELPLTVMLLNPCQKNILQIKMVMTPVRLMSLKSGRGLNWAGVDCVWCLKFADIRPMTAEDFVTSSS